MNELTTATPPTLARSASDQVIESLLLRAAGPITDARTLEDLTRPLLELLESVTGLESTYLTTIDFDGGVQQILFSRNAGAMVIPEGLSVPWGDTLCKRALDEGRMHTDDVPAHWGDSVAARELGITTYVSTPVHAIDGQLYGTLCGASATQQPLTPDAERVLKLFSKLIGQYVEREQLVQRLMKVNDELAAAAMTDPLTGLPNRRWLIGELGRMFARAQSDHAAVLVAFIDLDGFKAINDTHGHEVGDAFLVAMGQRISAGLRVGDMLARVGGDEFVMVGPATQAGEDPAGSVRMLQQRLAAQTMARFTLGEVVIDYGGASVGVVAIGPEPCTVDAALQMADSEMYAVKRERRGALAR